MACEVGFNHFVPTIKKCVSFKIEVRHTCLHGPVAPKSWLRQRPLGRQQRPRARRRHNREEAASARGSATPPWAKPSLKGPWCRLEGGWIGVTTKLNFFSPNTWADSAPPVRPVVMTGQTGQALDFTGDTGQTGASHRSDRCSAENLQKQLQASLGF
jgi:hypothetical protein